MFKSNLVGNVLWLFDMQVFPDRIMRVWVHRRHAMVVSCWQWAFRLCNRFQLMRLIHLIHSYCSTVCNMVRPAFQKQDMCADSVGQMMCQTPLDRSR